ncbi:restriction endonuclease subunit S [Prevotella histicola]|uniref:restriction endonuclease subunit S n=1 Tax=Prevotella histicola TaxID=470565 RepID=UPI003C72EEB5
MEVRIGDSIECNPTVKLVKGNEYPLIDIDKITVGRKLVTNKDTIVYEKQSGCKFQNGDTLMARITPCLENGKMAMASIPDKGIGSTELFVFRGKKGITDNDFVYYFLKQSYIRNLAANSMTGASGRQRADLKFIKKIKFDLPSLPTQQKIAAILSTYDRLIENNTRRIRLLEQMAENLYKEWFVRFRFPEHEKVEMVNGLPKGWKINSLKEICEFKRGRNITSAEMCDGVIQVISAGITPSGYHNKANVHGVSVTMSSSGANAGYISIHYDDIWAADCSYISEKETEDIYYVYELLNNIRQVINNFQIGAAQPHVYPKDINRIKTCVPPKELRIKANANLSKIHKEIHKLYKQNQLLTRQRDLLLPRLMSGKLEVKS